MDRKSLLILVLSFGLLMLWYPLVSRIYPPQPAPATNAPANANTTSTGPAPAPATASPLPAAAPTATLPPSGTAEETVTIENDNARYVFTSHGGGLKLVELKHYPETVGRVGRRRASTNNLATLNTRAPVPVFAVLGAGDLQGDSTFQLSRTETGVRAEKALPSGLHLIKDFQLGTNYLLSATLRVENRTNQPVRLPVKELVIGTATPLGPTDQGTLMAMEWYDGSDAVRADEAWFANRTLGCFPGTPRGEYLGGASNVVWASVQNQFFAMITVSPTNAPAPRVVARNIPLPPPTAEDLEVDPKAVLKPFGFQTALLYPETVLAPGQVLERRYDVFAGPKEYKTLDRLASRLGNNIDLVMRFGGFFGFFAKALLLSMNGLHNLFNISYALCIIIITVIIKLLFWPLTLASMRSMKRMSSLQPQMKAIQEKYKEDPRKMQQKMSEFWKEHKINPAAGCLPMLIQLPIFIGFYQMLQSAIELRGAPFLWAADLSQPDTVWIIPGLNFPVNPLPLIYGVTLIWQARITPMSPGMDPAQQQMMKYMPVVFLFILYNMPAGLTLYWTVQNLLTIAQMKLTKSTEPVLAPQPAAPARPEAVRPTRKKK